MMTKTVTKEEIEQAILDAEYGRASHVEWRDYLQACKDPDCENCKNSREYGGSLQHQVEWIERYDRILKILKSLI